MPLAVGVVGDCADRADTSVINKDVEAAEPLGRLVNGRADAGIVGHVGRQSEESCAGRKVEHGYSRATCREKSRRRRPDAGSAAGHDRSQAAEVGRHYFSSAVDSPPTTRARNKANRMTAPSIASIQ